MVNLSSTTDLLFVWQLNQPILLKIWRSLMCQLYFLPLGSILRLKTVRMKYPSQPVKSQSEPFDSSTQSR